MRAPGRFSLTLISRTNHRALEDIVVSIDLGDRATSVSATATGDRGPMHVPSNGLSAAGRRDEGATSGSVGGGTWEFDPHTHVSFRWFDSVIAADHFRPFDGHSPP